MGTRNSDPSRFRCNFPYLGVQSFLPVAFWLVVFGFNEGSARVYFAMSYITSWNALCIFHQVLVPQNHQLPWSVFALVWTSSPSQRNPRPSSFILGAFPGRRVLPSVTGGAWHGSVIPLAGTLGYRSLGGSGIGTKHVTLGEVKPQACGLSTPSSASPLGPQGMGASRSTECLQRWPWAGGESLLLFSHTEKEQDAEWMRAGVLLSQPSSQDPLPGTRQEYVSRWSHPGSEQALLGRLLPERPPHSLGEWLPKVAGRGWGVYEILRPKM